MSHISQPLLAVAFVMSSLALGEGVLLQFIVGKLTNRPVELVLKGNSSFAAHYFSVGGNRVCACAAFFGGAGMHILTG